mgnify:CR=1 FL=1
MTPLPADALRRVCDLERLPFETTAELPDLPEPVGQERALDALRLAVGMRRPGFNVFAFGPADVGVADIVHALLERHAKAAPTPPGWVYVQNFADPQRPQAIPLPPGRAPRLRDDMARLIEGLRSAIPAAFESEQYRARVQVIEEEVKERHQKALEAIEAKARRQGIALVRTPIGMGFAPLAGDEVMPPDEFARLPEDERNRIAQTIEALQAELQAVIAQFPLWQREGMERIKALNREFTQYAVGHAIEELRQRYADLPAIVTYLDRVQQDVVEHVDLFRRQEPGAPLPDIDHSALRRYEVNVLVDHVPGAGAPVVDELHPTYPNLIGRVEHRAAMGTLVTDFTLIRPGALHRAAGGFLVLDVRRVLMQPWAWEGLKQALRAREIRIESPAQVFSVVSTVTLEPVPIPLDVTVVLVGEPLLYYLLERYDPDIGELFKVVADFDDVLPRSDEALVLYTRHLATRLRAAGLAPLDRAAVALVLEESARLVGDAMRLSAGTRRIDDLLVEANHRARARGAAVIGRADVAAARDAAIARQARLRERLLEETTRGTLLVDTSGERVGQVNGLSVIQLGEFSFGRPSRITARVSVGAGKVVDIEREVALGGPLHSKGVLILAGFLAARFGLEEPLSLAATLVFEQSYGAVEGDSASSAELYALLSALADLPIQQRFAVTGSVNQHGDVQAIGGVNEKIEGFFDLCRARGLDGRQGVLIPAANVQHLVLREDVVEAVRAGQFAIYPVRTVDEGISLLTGVPAGEPDARGVWPEGTVNRQVADRLRAFSESRRRYAAGGRMP